MMAGNPSNWWSMHSNLRSSSSASEHHHHHHHQHDEAEVVPTNNLLISQTHPSNSLFPPLQFLHGHGGGGGGGGGSSSSSCAVSSSSSPSLLPFITPAGDPHGQDFPHSWSQLLLGGLGNEQDHHHHHHHHHQERFSSSPSEFDTRAMNDVVKQEVNINNNNNNNNLLQLYGNQFHEEQQDNNNQVSLGVSNDNRGAAAAAAAWTHHHQIMSASLSPKSCITSLNSSSITTTNNNNSSSSNMLDFSTNNRRSLQSENHQHAELTTNSECNSTATTGGVLPKKPRVQSSSNPPLKVRKEKLGDRITALHQLVSPFGKTDTASVLLEAIGYIRFLQGQIEALSSPYIGNNNASAKNQYSVNGERNCLFPDHPGQLLNDSCLKRRRAANQEDNKDAITKDLKSRGLCLVPTSCTQLVGSDNGADYWAQSLGGGGF